MENKYISYLRVSTLRQGISGLGLESQRAIISNYLKNTKVHNEFVEVESGGKDQRPQLMRALEVCREVKGSILIIAKLDRLSRSVSFISTLMESKVNFVCCDMPTATPLTLHIFASLAEWERKMISERTKNALQAKMVRDNWKAGNPANLTKEARLKSYQTIKTNARSDQSVRHAYHYIKPLKENGMTYQQIADMLNMEGYKTRTGKSFHAQQVRNIWIRLQRDEDKQITQIHTLRDEN